MCAPDPPPPPDVIGQANAQGTANREAALTQGRINNPNIVGPGSSRTVTWDGETPTITTNLTPEEWAIYNQNTANRGGLGRLASQGIDSAQGIIGSPIDTTGLPSSGGVYNPDGRLQTFDPNRLPGMPSVYQGGKNLPGVDSGEGTRNRVIQAMLSRSNERIGQGEEQTKSDLIAAGIRPGTEAYAREMDAIGRQRNDAMSQAEIAGGDAAQQQFGMDAARRAQIYGEGTTDAGLMYEQGMGVRRQGQGEQGQQFQQQGSASELAQRQQGQQNSQQNEARRQAIAEAITKRQLPLNEIIALMSGTQTNGAQSLGGPAFNASQVAPAPIFAANQANNQYGMDVYNSQAATANQRQQAIGQAAITAMMMY